MLGKNSPSASEKFWRRGIRSGENITIIATIVGIDPGTNTGIAVLDLHGRLIHLSSKRNIGKSEIIRRVTKFGKPLIVTVDVAPAPRNVERIASSMGSILFLLEKSISTKEKNDIVKRFKRKYKKEFGIELKIGNRHERDALAASVKAWKGNNYLLRKVNNALHRRGLERIFDNVVEILVKGESENITNAISEVLKGRKLRKRIKRRAHAKKRKKKRIRVKRKRRGKG